MSFPCYAEYCHSGAECLNEVPKHWHPKRLRNVLSFSKGLTITKEILQDKGIPCVNYGEIHSKYGFRVNPAVNQLRCVATEYQSRNPGALLRNGDFVFADTSEDLEGSGNFTHVQSDVPLFAGYHTIVGRPNETVCPLFLAFQLHSHFLRSQIQGRVKGIKVYSVSQAILKSVKCWLPPLDEQKAIASFLDVETSKIDALVSEQRRLIELLKEKRLAVISHAVTKGLNPNAPMKPSGIQWLGDVPEHWEVVPTKRFFGLIAEPAPKDNDHELLSIYTDIGVRPRKSLEAKGNKATTTDGYWMVRKGDLIVNKLLAWMGAIGMSEYEGVTSPAYDILRQTRELNPKFYHYLFRCGICFTEFRRFSRGIMDMRLRLYFQELGQLPMPFPPIDEQDQIVSQLEAKLSKLDALSAEAERAIELLQERRTALISAAVTGKIDVRGFVSKEAVA